jgi:hypothetical protein
MFYFSRLPANLINSPTLWIHPRLHPVPGFFLEGLVVFEPLVFF